MTGLRRVKISGTGMYLPPRKFFNSEYEAFMDTSDEWIQQRSGIKSRHYVEPHVATSDLGVEAARAAIASAGLKPGDIDLIIAATLSPDHAFPGIGVKIQHKLGLTTTGAMDIRCQCTGFIYALNVGQLFVASGQYDRVLVVGAEIQSKLADMSTAGREVTVLFGDGAGAVVLEPSGNLEQGILSCHLHAQGEHWDKLYQESPGTQSPQFITAEDIAAGRHWVHMDGKQVFKHATRRFKEVIEEGLEKNELKVADVDHFLFHQANIRISDMVGRSMGLPAEKVPTNIEHYGNCSAASIPILLDESVRSGRIKSREIICLAAFGAGFTWASAFIRW